MLHPQKRRKNGHHVLKPWCPFLPGKTMVGNGRFGRSPPGLAPGGTSTGKGMAFPWPPQQHFLYNCTLVAATTIFCYLWGLHASRIGLPRTLSRHSMNLTLIPTTSDECQKNKFGAPALSPPTAPAERPARPRQRAGPTSPHASERVATQSSHLYLKSACRERCLGTSGTKAMIPTSAGSVPRNEFGATENAN